MLMTGISYFVILGIGNADFLSAFWLTIFEEAIYKYIKSI